MRDFAVLVAPSANRVYTGAAARMLGNEIRVFGELMLDGSIGEVRETAMGGVPYLVFRAEALSERDHRCLSNLSALHALYEVEGGLLRPVAVERLDRYDDDLLTILKYAGKTNEQFTKLLLNVTTAALGAPDRFLGGGLRVLDPMCGRGTTLSQAVMYGHDACGIDVDKRDFEGYSAFVQRWMRHKGIKHKALKTRVKRDGKGLGQRLVVEFAATKERYRAGDLQVLEMVNTDTLHSRDVYRSGAFDLVVSDVPYGVKHGAVRSSRSPSRSPAELLASAIPLWSDLLRAGGAIGLSWNTYVLERGELAAMLAASGLEVMDTAPFTGFEHRVDQAIVRDLIVARKPK